MATMTPAQVIAQVKAQMAAAAKAIHDMTPVTRWKGLGAYMGKNAKKWKGSRPSPNAQPETINAWLVQSGISPVFAYPEFGWSFNGDNASASYSLGSGDSVTWTATSAGLWHYEHVWNTTLGNVMDDVVSSLAILSSVTGFVFLAMFLNTAQAIADKKPLSELGQALKADFDATVNSGQLAFAIVDGDWQQAWDHATQYGKDLSGIIAAWSPSPAPDASGNLTIHAPTSNLFSLVAAGAPKPMANIVLKMPYAIKSASASVGLSPPENDDAVSLDAPAGPDAPAPTAAPQHFWQKTIFTLGKTPITVGEGGVVVAGLGLLAKLVL